MTVHGSKTLQSHCLFVCLTCLKTRLFGQILSTADRIFIINISGFFCFFFFFLFPFLFLDIIRQNISRKNLLLHACTVNTLFIFNQSYECLRGHDNLFACCPTPRPPPPFFSPLFFLLNPHSTALLFPN